MENAPVPMLEEEPANLRAHRHPDESALREASGQDLKSTPPLMPIMKYMPPSTLVFVPLIYQGKTQNLFLVNLAPVWCFLVAFCLYWLIAGAMKQIATTHQELYQIFSQAALACGVLSILSLVSIFIPFPFSLLPIVIWVPLFVVLVWPMLCHTYNLLKRGITSVFNKLLTVSDAYNLLKRGITSVFNKLHAITIWARGHNPTESSEV